MFFNFKKLQQVLKELSFSFFYAEKCHLLMSETDYKSLGTLLTVAGGLSFISSIFSGFNRRMTIVSNVLFFLGVFLVLGIKKFISFITNKKRMLGTIIYSIGFLLILFGRNGWGGFLQIFGLLAMFGGFIPKLLNKMQKLPYIGKYFRFALPSFLYDISNEELPY